MKVNIRTETNLIQAEQQQTSETDIWLAKIVIVTKKKQENNLVYVKFTTQICYQSPNDRGKSYYVPMCRQCSNVNEISFSHLMINYLQLTVCNYLIYLWVLPS